MTIKPNDFAISFAGHNSRIVGRKLETSLTNEGASVFFDESFDADLYSSSNGSEYLENAFGNARVCIILVSKEYEKSSWAKLELNKIISQEALGETTTVFVKTSNFTPSLVPENKIPFDLVNRSFSQLVDVLLNYWKSTENFQSKTQHDICFLLSLADFLYVGCCIPDIEQSLKAQKEYLNSWKINTVKNNYDLYLRLIYLGKPDDIVSLNHFSIPHLAEVLLNRAKRADDLLYYDKELNRPANHQKAMKLYKESINSFHSLRNIAQKCSTPLFESGDFFDIYWRIPDSLTQIILHIGDKDAIEEHIEWLLEIQSISSQINNVLANAYVSKKVGDLFFRMGNVSNAKQHYQQSLVNMRKADDQEGKLNCMLSLASLFRFQTEVDEAQEMFRECYTLSKNNGSMIGMANALTGLANIYGNQGKKSAAIEASISASILHKRAGNPRGRENALRYLGHLWMTKGALSKAQVVTRKARQLAIKQGNAIGIMRASEILSRIYKRQGKVEDAILLIEETLSLHCCTTDIVSRGDLLLDLGNLYIQTQDLDNALKKYDDAIALFSGIGLKFGIAKGGRKKGILLLIMGRHTAALESLKSASEIHNEHPRWASSIEGAHLLLAFGRYFLETHQYRDASEKLKASIKVYNKIGDSLGIASGLQLLGTLEAINGSTSNSRTLLVRSLTLFHQNKSTYGVKQVESLLDQYNIKVS